MRKDTKQFVLFLKTLKSGEKMYYYVVRDENNRRLQYSTGESDQQKALMVCLEKMSKGKLIPKSRLSFSEYAKDFYDYEKSPYIQGKLKRGFSYARASADTRSNFIRNEAMPFFGDKLISRISPKDIENFILRLKSSGISNNTLNGKIKTLRQIFRYAFKMHDIDFDPTTEIMLFKNDTAERGIFSEEEIDSLFGGSDSIEKYWGGDTVAYTMNLFALKTGCRLGEIQALCAGDIKDECVSVSKSWNEKYGLGTTKTGKSRVIPIGDDLKKRLLMLTWGKDDDDFIFANKNGNRPIARTRIYPKFYAALEKVGIDAGERKKRNLSFHCWRHTFASRLANANIPELYIRRLTGHSSTQILDVYSHIQIEKLKEAIDF